jgi:mannosyltransferase OCH1-like enzyme
MKNKCRSEDIQAADLHQSSLQQDDGCCLTLAPQLAAGSRGERTRLSDRKDEQPLASETSVRAIYRDRLRQARDLIAAGNHAEARRALDALKADEIVAANRLLGETTVLGLPRQLHSAYLKLAKAEKNLVERIGLQHSLVPDPALLERFAAFGIDEIREMTRLSRQPVPRIIHQIWLGSLAVPGSTERWAAHAAKTGFEYRLWRESDLEALGVARHPAYLRMLEDGDYPGAVDVARYFVLHALGGIYIDCDWYPTRDDIGLADLLPLVGLMALPEDTPRETGKGSLLLTNSLIAAPPAHPVFARLLQVLPEVVAALPEAPAWWSTGPLIMTVVFRGTIVSVPDAGLVAANLRRGAPFSEVEAACAAAVAQSHGLLVGWKSW